MKLITAFALAATSLISTSQALAADSPELTLAKAKSCMACHAEDKKLMGPSFKEVADKYKGQKDAEAKLIDKVKKGGSGAFGPIPMPPNATVSDADLKTLVAWVLKR